MYSALSSLQQRRLTHQARSSPKTQQPSNGSQLLIRSLCLQSFYVAARGNVANVRGLIISAAAMNVKRNLVMHVLQPFQTVLNWLAPNAAIVPVLDPALMARNPAVVRYSTQPVKAPAWH